MEKADCLLKRLPFLDIVELREQWFLHYYGDAGNRLQNKFLRLAVGFRVQELEQDATARCDAIRRKAAEYHLQNSDIGRGRSRFLKPGTRLIREYKGKVHEVLAIENGRFVYAGHICNSLTEAAARIGCKNTSGAIFFGLYSRKRGRPND